MIQPAEGSRPRKQMATRKVISPRRRPVRTSRRADKSSAASAPNFMERMAPEILIKILSYLDASALYSMSHVSKRFYQLANDNVLWSKIYKANHKKTLEEELLQVSIAEDEDRPVGYWKWQHFKKTDTCLMKKFLGFGKWARFRHVFHTLPGQTEQVLRNLRVTWELTVSSKSGREATLESSQSHFFDNSVTLCWNGSCLPDYQLISTLQLHGVRRIPLNCPGLKGPGWRSLILKLDVKTPTKSAQVLGRDRLVEVKLLQPGVIVGFWKDQPCIAFLMLTIHLYRLVERSTLGSSLRTYAEPTVRPPFDDIDAEYGLHGYHLHIALHNTAHEIMSESYSQLFCRRNEICDGLIPLTVVSRTNLSRHTPLSGTVTLPWRSEALQGTVENCCVMSLALLDESRRPFWVVSSPVAMKPVEMPVSYDYHGEHFLIHYRDSEGQVKMNLVWMKEQMQFVLISLVVYTSTSKVNEYFGRDY